MTKVFYFIFILFFIGTVSAGEFSISPPQVNFEGELKQEICGNFFISTPEKSILIGEDRWGEKEETRRKFSAHTLSSEELGLEIKYPELIESEGEMNSEICISGEKEGNYHGLLLYRLEGAPTGIGIWLNVSLKNEGRNILGITGNIISEGNIGIMGISSFVLVFILVGLIFVMRRKKCNSM
ncbi:hypothetical protein HOD29_01925 [archaeon]|jgi:hypothetical protein|nr:hypothetical protein [archaeon]